MFECYTKHHLQIKHDKAKPRVIGRRKATGPAFERGIAGLPEQTLKAALPGIGNQLFFWDK